MKMQNRQIYKATSRSTDVRDVRAVLYEPYLDVETSLIVATNGHILAACPVELDEGDTSGVVSTDAIKAAIKDCPVKERDLKTASIKANGALELDNGATYPRVNNGTFPQYQRVIPDKGKAEMVISFDAKLLKDLADAINTPGNSQVKLHIVDNNSAFYVESDNQSDCYGVLMPCRIN